MRIVRKTSKLFLVCLVVCMVFTIVNQLSFACSTLMIGRNATVDGSVLMGSSCDGDIMGLIYVMPAMDFSDQETIPMYWNVPRPTTYEEYVANLRKGYEYVGRLAVEKTYRSIILAGNVENMTTGGMNEFGLSVAIEFLSMREGLACKRGVVGPNSNHWTTSLIANALMRCKTAREAIQLVGSMVEEYGFLYYRAPKAGVALPIADENETWLMEIFGPGENWTPDSGKPGGVWCAQRIPDGEVGCSANRSRIGKVNLDDPDHFMTSSNIYSLAEELGFWDKSEPFVWYDIYGDPGSRYNYLREWRALSLAAPSLNLKVTGDPETDRYPFSVKPDKPVSVNSIKTILRDGYEGSEFDITEDPAFHDSDEKKSPLARPWGPPELFDLLDITPERALNTPTSGYVFISQLRRGMPDPIAHCMWFAYGPAYTSCFVPIYAGITDLPDSWDHPPDYTKINREQAQWNFRFVHNLANNLAYQHAIKNIHNVIQPAETNFYEIQSDFEKRAIEIFIQSGVKSAQTFVTEYANQCLKQVGYTYNELVDYLMFKYLLGHSEVAPPRLPSIAVPVIPDIETSASN